MTRDLHLLARRLQEQLMRAAQALPPETWANQVPRVMIDAWAALCRWHECGERIWRISAAAADETADMLLPPDLDLVTSRTRAEAVCYQLPDREQWIILARIAPPSMSVVVRHPYYLRYPHPSLVYYTQLADGTEASGVLRLDNRTPATLEIRPGITYGVTARQLTSAEIAEDDYRLSLALLHHYLPS